jgi:predicted RND superfamily exporter protein
VASGGLRQRRSRPDGVSPLVIFGHAGLALTGFIGWVSFTLTDSVVLAWLALGFLAPAIGLGIATVTVWTPYPIQRAPGQRGVGAEPPSIQVTDETLARAASEDALSGQLVDELLARVFTESGEVSVAKRPRWRVTSLIPAAHGVFALVTFLLATMAAVMVAAA